MISQLTYLPAYFGLFAALLLGVACNAFLDIRYGSFAIEVFCWAFVFAWTLRIGWRQQGTDGTQGKQRQLVVLIIGFVASILIFIPLWGFPRAGLYMLALLQASQNCVTTTRRQLHFGLLVSLVMVMFATSHARADWTMLFYVLPYIVAIVLTLVAEQTSRQSAELRRIGVDSGSIGGRGMAIAAATAIILALATTLYLLTPQVTWPYLSWRYGQESNLGWLGDVPEQTAPPSGGAHEPASGSAPDEHGNGFAGNRPGSGHDNADAEDTDSGNARSIPQRNWPTPAEMREAAQRPGMPQWQSSVILQMAELDEAIGETLRPLGETLQNLWNQLKELLQQNRTTSLLGLIGFLITLLLGGLYRLLREVKAAVWLRTRYDFLRLGLFARHAPGRIGAGQYFRAMERLFALCDQPRENAWNAREYLGEITHGRQQIEPELRNLTRCFEDARYGADEPDGEALRSMREAYRQLYVKLD